MYDRKTALRRKVSDIKAAAGCIVCEDEFCPVSLDFHGLNGHDDASISTLLSQGKGWARIQAEIDDSVVICKNCHAKVHEGLVVFEGSDCWVNHPGWTNYEDVKDTPPLKLVGIPLKDEFGMG